jgi:Coenzyme PQQ synthesis protein D (PqqD)
MVGYEGKVIGLKEHCVYASIGDEVVLLDVDKKIYYTINGPAALIVSTLAGEHGSSFADLGAKLMSRYTVTEAAAATELKGFLDELARLGFLMKDAKIPMEHPKIVQTGDVLSKVAVYIVVGRRGTPRLDPLIAISKRKS